jgi:cell fate (sporulation/competence/biofilm development) regulator YlbF (YheA/YmcA/DUF963 family)
MLVPNTMTKRLRALAFGLLVLALVASTAVAQESVPGDRGGRGRVAPGAQEGVSPGELQQLFDAYVVMQAQQELQLNDQQFGSFLSRVRTLQEARRRGQMQRNRMLQELRRLSQEAGADDQIQALLERLKDLERRNAEEIKDAADRVDEVLNVRQRARFRLLEEQMERRKLDLLMRARQQNRARPQF